MPCKNTDLLINNVDRQVQPCQSKRGLSENVYMMFCGNAMSQKVKSCLLCSTMLTFCFRRKSLAPVRDSRPMSRPRLSLAQAPLQDLVVHGHRLEDGGGDGNGGLGTVVVGLAFGTGSGLRPGGLGGGTSQCDRFAMACRSSTCTTTLEQSHV